MRQQTNHYCFRQCLVAWSVPGHYLNQYGILLFRTLETIFSEILSEIHIISFKKMHLKMSRPQCVNFGLSSWRWHYFTAPKSSFILIIYDVIHWKLRLFVQMMPWQTTGEISKIYSFPILWNKAVSSNIPNPSFALFSVSNISYS